MPGDAARALRETGVEPVRAKTELVEALVSGSLSAAALKVFFQPEGALAALGESSEDFFLLSRDFWDRLVLHDEFWISGDIHLLRDHPTLRGGRQNLRCYGIRFDRVGVKVLTDKRRARLDAASDPLTAREARSASNQKRRGPKKKPYWEAATANVRADIYSGKLRPQNQADVERAIGAFLAEMDIFPAESTIRRYATPIWEPFEEGR
jgi:hypothetical protein